MSIEIGPKLPIENRRFMPFIARTLLRIFRWKVVGSIPNTPKMILIGVPHSSTLDLFYVLLTVYSLDLKASFLAASWTFTRFPLNVRSRKDQNIFGVRWPLGFLQNKIMRRLGGIPVDRSKVAGSVDRLIERVEAMEKMILMITPEGGTRGSKELKSGFYVISERLNIPIVPIQFDYARRRFNLMEAVYPSGDKQADMKNLEQMFDGIEGRNRTFHAK